METSTLTDAEITLRKKQLANEERKRRLSSKDHQTTVQEDLAAAEKATDAVFEAYQYGGPTMHTVSHSELARLVRTLSRHVRDLLWLSEVE